MTIPDNHQYAPVAVPTYGYDDGGESAIPTAMATNLGEHFISTPTVDSPSPDAQPYLEVVAPATLPEGYTFEAEANGHSFTVKVPVGGVEEGQKFSVPFPAGSNGYTGAAIPRSSVPVGHWKDGLCDCFILGPIHPAIWNALCCPMIMTGQIMHRLKLTWQGNEGSVAQTAGTFRIFLSITLIYVFINNLLKYIPIAFIDADGEPTPMYFELVYVRMALNVTFFILTVALVTKVRMRIRSKYSIPEKSCKGMEDCCCALWCTCCTISQMARHTADYESYAALCCSETGMPPHAPSIV